MGERLVEPTAGGVHQGRRLSVAEIREDLRGIILDGLWPPGQAISQVQIAAVLGISRGKLREALRMLQEEGLVEGKEFHRLRVAAFNVDDLDSMYALRIATETLGVTITVPSLRAVEKVRLSEIAKQLRTSRRSVDEDEWNRLHEVFHDIVAGRRNGPFARQMETLSARSDRYRRMYFQAVERGLANNPGEHVHAMLAEAVVAGDVRGTTVLLARHYATTATSVVQVMAPGATLRAVSAALLLLGIDADGDTEPIGSTVKRMTRDEFSLISPPRG